MQPHEPIYVAGGATLIGAALVRALDRAGCTRIVNRAVSEPDLTDAAAVEAFFARTQPRYVFLAAGKSGGILANQRCPANLIRDNLLVNCHVIAAAHRHRVAKLLYLASSCSYPRLCPQPMRPEHLLTGPLEPTSEAYAVAKLAGVKLCQAYRAQHRSPFIVGVSANAFGPGDDFDPRDAHVIAALMRRLHEAKLAGSDEVAVWGTGAARREFIFADDLADAAVLVMRKYDDALPINLGGGPDVSIRELAELIREVVGYSGRLRFDATQPDGMPRKALDGAALAALGWRPATPLRAALEATYRWYLERVVSGCLGLSPRSPSARPGLLAGASKPQPQPPGVGEECHHA